MTPFDYREVQKQALKLLLVAFMLGGLFAVSCGRCDGLAAIAAEPEPTLTLSRAKWQQVMSTLVTRRIERDKALAKVKLLREQLRIERNASLSKLAAKDLEIGRLRKKCNAPPPCTEWKIATGAGIAATTICAAVLISREVVR